MRLLFTNYSHPEYQHVSALRVSRFADEMARRGHRVTLLTKTLHDDDSGPSPGEMGERLANHDWSRPFLLACPPRPQRHLNVARQPGASNWRSRVPVAREYLLHGGMFHDWVAGTKPYWKLLAETFVPEATWGTFGNLDALWIGRGIARRAGAAWCVDIKDNWDRFVPQPFRWMMGRRLRAATAVTANSELHGQIARRWIGRPFDTVYSGYEEATELGRTSPWGDAAPLFIGGSLYGEAEFRLLLDGVNLWWRNASGRRRKFVLAYAGADHARAAKLLANVPFPQQIMEFVPSREYAVRCRHAWVNAYLWSPHTFHHKAVELLAAGRPVLVVPGEHAETLALARRVGGELRVCRNAAEVAEALAQTVEEAPGGVLPNRVPPRMNELSWQRQGDVLEAILADAVTTKARGKMRRRG